MKMNIKCFILTYAIILIVVSCYKTSTFLKESESESSDPKISKVDTIVTSATSQQTRDVLIPKLRVNTSSNNFVKSSREDTPNPKCMGSTLYTPSSTEKGLSKLKQGEALCNENWLLELKNDGNLELKNLNGGVIWNSGKRNSNSKKINLELTSTGFLRVFDGSNDKETIWNQDQKFNSGNYALDLTESGNLIIRVKNSSKSWSQIWTLSNRSSLTSSLDDKSESAKLDSNQPLIIGKYIFANDPYGFLRFYEGGTEKWNIPINGTDLVAIIQNDGNFVTNGQNGTTWSTQTNSTNPSSPHTLFIDENKGQIVIKDAKNNELLRK